MAVAFAGLGAGATNAGAAIPQTPDAIREYWTPERMREAQPAEQVREKTGTMAGGAQAGPAAKRAGSNAAPVRHRKRFPQRTHGKVYFTMRDALNGPTDFVCSGTVVQAPSNRLVITAGHCAWGCDESADTVVIRCEAAHATNFNFVPAMKEKSDGTLDRPFGEWPAQAGGVHATGQYETSENPAYDVGAAVIASRNGREIEGVLGGGRGVAFNESTDHLYRAYGYPAEFPFDGETPYRCRVHSSGRDRSIGNGETHPIRIPCDMTGGSSGGAWVIDGGRVASVTAYGYGTQPDVLYGSYFGSAIKSFYDSVKHD